MSDGSSDPVRQAPAQPPSRDSGSFEPRRDSRPHDVPWPEMLWPPPDGIRLAGGVVELTALNPERDASELFAALDVEAVWKHMTAQPRSPAEYSDSLRAASQAGRFPWLVRLARTYAGLAAGSVVGTTSYLEIAPDDARLEIGHTAYAPAVWGTAVNPEAKLLLLSYAYDVLHAGRVQLKTDVRNRRSQQAIARLGASYEGTLRRYQRRRDASVRDTVLFSITAEEWPAVRNGLRARLT